MGRYGHPFGVRGVASGTGGVVAEPPLPPATDGQAFGLKRVALDCSPMLGAGLPVGDWQFWAVTGLFVLALAWICRGWLPVVGKRWKKRKQQRRVTLTVGGKTVR